MKARTLVPIALVALATCGSGAEYISDDFSFGPTARDREEITAGSVLGGCSTPIGGTQWQTPSSDERHGHANIPLVFTDANGADDKGLVTYARTSIAASYFVFEFPTDDRTTVATLEFLTNDSYPRGGAINLAFTADSPTYIDLLGTNTDYIALRFNPDPRSPNNPKLSYKCNLGGTLTSKTTSESLKEWKPDQVARLTLTYNPVSRAFTGKVDLVNQPEVRPLEISGTLESDTIFNHVHVEMTGQDSLAEGVKQAVFRKVETSIKK